MVQPRQGCSGAAQTPRRASRVAVPTRTSKKVRVANIAQPTQPMAIQGAVPATSGDDGHSRRARPRNSHRLTWAAAGITARAAVSPTPKTAQLR